MEILLGERAPLSAHVKNWAEGTRQEARGYRDMRNILFVCIVGATAIFNANKDINSLSPVDQIKFNAAGVGAAALSALGMEYGKRKREKWAKNFDATKPKNYRI